MKINSVLGEVKIEDVGVTLVHEHLQIKSDEVFNQFPHLYDYEYEKENAIRNVENVKEFDVNTICDPTVLGLGRDIKFLEHVSKATGMNIIAATGIYTYNEIPTHFKNQSIEYLSELFIRDIEKGVQNTNIKAGFLKCSADKLGVTTDIEKVMKAVALASRRTNKPIMAHSHPSSKNGLDIAQLLINEGVEPHHIQISHTGDTDNLEYIYELLDLGVFIGMDRYGLDKFAPTATRNNTLISLLKEGYERQIFLSQDYCCNTDWYSEDFKKSEYPNWSMDYIFTDITPTLKSNGVNQKQIDIILKENIKKWFQ